MYKAKYLVSVVLSLFLAATLFGCGGGSSVSAPSFSQIEPYTSEVTDVQLPTKGIIALGEATHGNGEFALLKLEVFQHLVEQSGIRAFALEGDFGGCQKVNDYIQTGEGTAEQAAQEIGFAIYKTEEMAKLLSWMQEYNAGKQPGEQIRFYGFDMQRYDNNKERLFAILSEGSPELEAKYQEALEAFSDDTMNDVDEPVAEAAIAQLEELSVELKAQKSEIVAATSEQEYELATQYATCLTERTQLLIANNYGSLRDALMAEHAQWIYEYETSTYGTEGMFITGHNSHVGKTTATAGTEKAMGQILSETYGADYYAIGTEFNASTFLAPDDSGQRREFSVQNSGDDRLAVLLNQSDRDTLYLDLDAASEDAALAEYLKAPQAMSAIGEYFSDLSGMSEAGYTQRISPQDTYNALIFMKSLTPSTML